VAKKKKVDSREIGLEMGLLLGRFFQKSEDLHYGYWPEDLEVQFSNFSEAQSNHSEYIIANVPSFNLRLSLKLFHLLINYASVVPQCLDGIIDVIQVIITIMKMFIYT